MRYWWVNQNQTYRHEVQGGYLWSPKRKSNGHVNPFYEFMREVTPGDVVYSFADTYIKAIGIVASYGYESPKPDEFGRIGANWGLVGWRVDVDYHELISSFRPVEAMDRLAPFLPKRYAPLRPNGHGLQSVYLTLLSDAFALEIADLIGYEARVLISGARVAELRPLDAIGITEWEERQATQVQRDTSLSETTKQAVVQARRGQGLFKQRVMQVESRCRLTGVDRPEHLRASHCKPWRDANNEERLDGENGLLLTPDADHLFDRGFLTFDGAGKVLVSPVAHMPSLIAMGIDPERALLTKAFSSGQKSYLAYHRENIFLKARLRAKL